MIVCFKCGSMMVYKGKVKRGLALVPLYKCLKCGELYLKRKGA